MLFTITCRCGVVFQAKRERNRFCGERCRKAHQRERWHADPNFRAQQLARQRTRGAEKRAMSPDERQLITDCYEAGWGGVATAGIIWEVLGIRRCDKVIRAFCVREFELHESSTAASERIPDYRGANDAFVAAVRAAHPEIKEGIFKDSRPLVPDKFFGPAIYGASVAGAVAELGSAKGLKW